MRYCLSFILSILFFTHGIAQKRFKSFTEGKYYVGNALDFMMLSTAIVSKPGSSSKLTTPRFTAFVNFGFTLNHDINAKWGWSTGLGLRNMGFIEKEDELTIKRRVYSVGVPFGFKYGDLRNRKFKFFGAGVDFPFHYFEKRFVERSDKIRNNEWFSDRTPKVMPFAFIGQSFDPGITFKLQYYPLNFLNEDFATSDNIKLYEGYKVNLILFSLGIDIHYNMYKRQQREYLDLKKGKE